MNSYSNEIYGERVAAVYDDFFADYEPGSIEALAQLAQGGPALELGIGTGRIALPLVSRGVKVEGIDAAPSMVERLRAKPLGDQVTVHMGDFAEVAVEGKYSLIFVVFNTFFALTSQEVVFLRRQRSTCGCCPLSRAVDVIFRLTWGSRPRLTLCCRPLRSSLSGKSVSSLSLCSLSVLCGFGGECFGK